ncbi:MAG: response regulator [Elusimicrobia bacterium]|nr:response regulator [Elusimicrobiota bacterium]
MKLKILIVEDEPHTAETLQSILEIKGFQTEVARDGKTAVLTAKQNPPDLILLDLLLPRLDGFQVCQMLKQNQLTSKIPILVLTSLEKMGSVEKAFAAGATDYLTKPIQTQRLMGKIHKLLPESEPTQK